MLARLPKRPTYVNVGLTVALMMCATATLAPGAGAQERTIELVSGGLTGGNGATAAAFAGASVDGSRIFFTTTESLLAGDSDGAKDVYERVGSTLTLISGGSADATFEGASADGSRVFFETSEALVAPDSGTAIDVYERSAAGLTLISGGSSSAGANFRGASADGSRVFFETTQQVLGTDSDGGAQDVYERSASGYALISGGTAATMAFFNAASADGSRVFFATLEALLPADTEPFGTPAQDIYERSGGALTLVSGGTEYAHASFSGNSADGSRVFFFTDERLVTADTDTAGDVYERSGGVHTLISGGTMDMSAFFRGASADGSRVFFNTNESLAAADTDTTLDIYERSGGTHALATGGSMNVPAFFKRASADGSRLFFETDEALDAADTDTGSQDVYERSGGALRLISGGAGNRLADFAGASDDGSRVFFETDEALLAADTDAAQDIYERFGTALTLVSGGAANADAFFNAASADGSRVFFRTDEALSPGDADSSDDVYVSRPADPVPPSADGGGGSGGGGAAGTADLTRPVASSLAIRPRRFNSARRGASIAAAVGATVRYVLSEPAGMRFAVRRARRGRRAGRRCVAPTRRNRRARPCTRYVRQKGSFSHQGRPGSNSFRFTGRLARRRLAVGSYRLIGVPTDAAGNRGGAVRASFRIARR